MLRPMHNRYQLVRLRKRRFPRYLYWVLAPLPIHVLAYLILHATYSVIYDGSDSILSGLEFPITYAVLGMSGMLGGSAALVGLYNILAHSRAWVSVMVIGLLVAPSLLWAGASLYALLIFMAIV